MLRITPLLRGSRGAPPAVADVLHRATGSEARAFAAVIRKHTLEGTGGQTYAQMGRYLDANGKPTNDEKAAATDSTTGQPVENAARSIWISSTA